MNFKLTQHSDVRLSNCIRKYTLIPNFINQTKYVQIAPTPRYISSKIVHTPRYINFKLHTIRINKQMHQFQIAYTQRHINPTLRTHQYTLAPTHWYTFATTTLYHTKHCAHTNIHCIHQITYTPIYIGSKTLATRYVSFKLHKHNDTHISIRTHIGIE